jgi:NADH-quinone oxidoreductase subunit N
MGFLGKFYVLAAGASAAAWALILILVLRSVAGLFYYLRIVVALSDSDGISARCFRGSDTGRSADLLGVYPSPLLNLIRNTMAGLSFATQMGPHERRANGIARRSSRTLA